MSPKQLNTCRWLFSSVANSVVVSIFDDCTFFMVPQDFKFFLERLDAHLISIKLNLYDHLSPFYEDRGIDRRNHSSFSPGVILLIYLQIFAYHDRKYLFSLPSILLHYLYLVSGVALHTCSLKKVFWNNATNLQENTHVEV